MSNFTLVKPDATTLALSVTGIGTLFDGSTRGAQATSTSGMVYGLGDFTEEVKPIQFKIRVTDHQGDEAAARAELAVIREFAKAAQYLKRDATGYYRALQAGFAVASFDPQPIGARLDAWTATLVLLPMFPDWTATPVSTLADYLTGTQGPDLNFALAKDSQYLTLV